ncbi:MAG: PadR family transcriptional regulator [Alphaproteobacteria bacterium]|nr:MAG: PadR family transcriptional regulator [Alphaproteobacteria bacterium]
MALDVKMKCLGVLSWGDASGYEIQKEFSEGTAGHFVDASFGSIYPALNRLMEEGHVTCKTHAQDGRPDKKVYSITPAGRLAFQQALKKAPSDDKFRSEFLFYMLFADDLAPEYLAELLDSKTAEIDATIELIKENDGPLSPGQEFVRGYGLAVHEAIKKYLSKEKARFIKSSTPDTAKAG